ncbi:MAG: hypothetical protein HQL28_07335 [Candidatus Omnitrophica bacterium]|nr:hypothetical protein [Candidatus Omnitrophota bacterium]
MVKLLLFILMHDLILACGQTTIKKSLNTLGGMSIASPLGILHFLKTCLRDAKIWLGLGLNTVSLFIWLVILSFADLSQAYPLDSMQYIIIAIFAKNYLKEEVNVMRWTGIFLIVIGVTIVGLK